MRTWIVALLLVTTVLTSCSKKQERANISISIPETLSIPASQKTGALGVTELTLKHVVLNISAKDIETIVKSWDSHDCSGCKPTIFENIEVTPGSDRLIQVLSVYGGSDKSYTFYYGDVTKTLTSGSNDVLIDSSALNSTSTANGQIMGRFYDANGRAPSGKLNIRYAPGDGKQTMLIETTEMFGGWFRTFSLADIPFKYELIEDGGTTPIDIFGGPVHLNSSLFSSPSTLRVQVPAHVQVWNSYAEPAETFIVGNFGSVPSGKAVCRPAPYTYSYRLQSVGGSPLNFPGSFGVTGASTICPSTGAIDNYVSFFPAMHDNGGNDSAVGFKGPFKRTSSGRLLDFQNGKLDWDYLPGITNDLVSKVRIFTRSESSSSGGSRDYEQSGQVDCGKLVESFGFTKKADVDFSQASEKSVNELGLTTYTTVIVCAYNKADTPYKTVVQTMWSPSYGSPSTSQPAMPVPIPTLIPPPVPPSPPFATPTPVVSPTPPTIPQISTPTPTPTPVATPTPTPTPVATPSPTPTPTPSPSPTPTPTNGVAGVPTKLFVTKAQQPFTGASEGNCHELLITLRDYAGDLATTSSSVHFTLNKDAYSGSNQFFATKNNCASLTSPIGSSFSIAAGESHKKVWAQANYGSPQFNIVLGYSGPLNLSLFNLELPVKSYSSRVLYFEGPTKLYPDLCYPLTVRHGNYDLYPYDVSAPTLVGFTVPSGVNLYSTANCTTPLTSSVQINSGTSSYDIWIKLSGSAPLLSKVTASVLTGATADNADIYFEKGGGSASLSNLKIDSEITNNYRESCSGPYIVSFLNDQGVALPLGSAANVNMTSSPSPVEFYLDYSCTTAVSSLPAAVGTTSTKFYLKPSSAGVTTITAQLNDFSDSKDLTVNGLHRLNLSTTESTTISHGACVELIIEPRNFDNSSGSFSAETALQFWGGDVYARRVGTTCVEPVSSSTFPAYTSSKTVYMVMNNPSSSPASITIQVGASNVQSGTLNFSVGAPPTLALIDTNLLRIATEYPFNLLKTLIKNTGVAPFTFSMVSGSGTLNSGYYMPPASPGSTAQFTIHDSRSGSSDLASVSTTTHSRSALFDFSANTMPGSFSFNRTSTGSYYNSAGLLVSASYGAPRFDHDPDPTTGFAPKGLLLEGATMNLLAQSEAFDQGGWSPNTLEGGVSVASGITSPRGSAGGVYQLNDFNQNPYNVGRIANVFSSDLADQSYYVASVFIKKATSRYAGLMFQENGVTSTGVIIDLDTGAASQMEGPYTPQVSHGFGVQKLNNGWYRIWVRYFTSGCSTCQGWIAIFPAHSLSGSRMGDISANGAVYVFGAQVEQGGAMTSYIPTATTTVTRAADDLSINVSAIPSFYSTMGTMRMEFSMVSGTAKGLAGTIAQLCGSSCANESMQVSRVNENMTKLTVTAASTLQPIVMTSSTLNNSGSNVLSFGWGTLSGVSGFNLGLNGDAKNSGGTSVGLPSIGGGKMRFGNSESLNEGVPIHLKKLEYWPQQLSTPALGSF